jgi:hypothetical protein
MKYVKTIKEFTHLHQGALIPIKEGTLMERTCSEEGTTYSEFYRPLGWDPNIIIGSKIVESNPNYFCEITETEWMRETKYAKIFRYILELDPYINWQDLISTIDDRFVFSRGNRFPIKDWVEKLSDPKSGAPANPHPTYPGVVDTTRCTSCGNLKGSPCWSTACPQRIQIWYSTNTGTTN